MQDERVERYWTERAARVHDEVMANVPDTNPERDAYLWMCARRALEARDPESLSGVMRVCDMHDISTHVRFSTAVGAMAAKAYDCAYAAWDDAGNCWSRESENPNVPSSFIAAETMKSTCEPLIAATSISAEAESSLCAAIREKLL
jgi:hypothetical protein